MAEDSGEKCVENVLTKTLLLWRYNLLPGMEKGYQRKTCTILNQKITHSEMQLNVNKTVRKACIQGKVVNNTKATRNGEVTLTKRQWKGKSAILKGKKMRLPFDHVSGIPDGRIIFLQVRSVFAVQVLTC